MANESLIQRRDRALGAGAELFYENPIEMVRGEGAYLFDREGRRYVDLYNNVPCVGHGNPAVARAMAEQQATLNVHSRYLSEGIVQYAERLANLNHDGIESVVFSCSGTEAVEVAIMMARLVTGKQGLVCTDATYHGNSTLVDSMSDLHRKPTMPHHIHSFPYPDLYRPVEPGVDEETLSQLTLEHVSKAIDELKSEGSGFAALIVCSIFANEGLPDVPPGLMAQIAELCHAEGGLLIADEVQSGYGRTGRFWGYEKMGFKPDMVVGGKPMGNGLPISAVATRKDYVDEFRARKDYFNTCSATPLQAAVGLAVLDEIDRMGLVAHAGVVGDYLAAGLRQCIDLYEPIGDVRGCGLFLSVEMVQDPESKSPDAKATKTLANHLKDRGFLVSHAGKYENVLKIRPPLVFSQTDADDFLAAFDDSMKALCGR